MRPEVRIRSAHAGDMHALGALGAQLAHAHYEYDRERFLAPDDGMRDRYAEFLAEQLHKGGAAVLVAELDGLIVGYVYAGLEPASMHELRDEAGFIHDLVVIESARRQGIAAELLEAACGWLRERGARRVLLWRSPKNDAAGRLFIREGFRVTMIEMTREL